MGFRVLFGTFDLRTKTGEHLVGKGGDAPQRTECWSIPGFGVGCGLCLYIYIYVYIYPQLPVTYPRQAPIWGPIGGALKPIQEIAPK